MTNSFLRQDGEFANLTTADLPPSATLYFNVKDAAYGALGNGIHDDAPAFQAAVNAAQAAGGGVVFLPTGTYQINTTLSVTGQVSFLGVGTTSVIQPAVEINGINFNLPAANTIFCKDFRIVYPSIATGGTAGITLTCSASSMTFFCLFDNLEILQADTCLKIDKSANFTIRACVFNTFGTNGGSGLFIQNTFNADNGDFSIEGNTFLTLVGTSIFLQGVGGARIINNKIGTGGLIGIDFQQPNGTSSSLLMITGNSIEGFTLYGIRLIRQGTTGLFTNVTINDNEFESNSAGPSSCINIPTDANGVWIRTLVVSDNIDTTGLGSFHAFIDMNSTSTFSITGNVGFLVGTPANMNMIITRSAADTGVVGPNIHTLGINGSSIGSTNTTTISPT